MDEAAGLRKNHVVRAPRLGGFAFADGSGAERGHEFSDGFNVGVREVAVRFEHDRITIYVAGYSVRKLEAIRRSHAALFASNLLPHHVFAVIRHFRVRLLSLIHI